MTPLLAQHVYLMSIVKPVFFILAVGGWAWVVAQLDKDAAFYYLKRHMFNLVQVGAAVLGFGVMLLVPIFWIGYPMGLLLLGGGIAGYVYYRNQQVPEAERWKLSLEGIRERRAAKKQEAMQRKATLVITTREGAVPIPDPTDPDLPQYMALDELFNFALLRNAATLDLSVDAKQAKYRVTIDGVRYPQDAPEPAEAIKLIDYVKKVSGMDLEDRRKKQSAKMTVRVEGSGTHELELVSAGSTRGLQLHMRFDPTRHSEIPIGHLGLLPGQLESVRGLLHEPGKVVLVASAPHQGGYTTLYSLLREHDPYTASILTLEDDPLHELEGISHNTFPAGKPAAEFNDKLGALLRGDPNIVMVGRLADPQTAKILAQSADEIRSYVPIAQEDTLAALRVWMKAVDDPRTVGEGLGAILAQRLVRRLCHTCRVAYSPDPAALKKLNLPADKVGELFRASGKVMDKDKEIVCPDCHGLGYRGRVGVFEVMIVDGPAAKYIAANELDTLRLHLRKQKMLYLQEAALAKVVDGTTDIKEVTRVMVSKPT